MICTFIGPNRPLTPEQISTFDKTLDKFKPNEFHFANDRYSNYEAIQVIKNKGIQAKIVTHEDDNDLRGKCDRLLKMGNPIIACPEFQKHRSNCQSWVIADKALRYGKTTVVILPNGDLA